MSEKSISIIFPQGGIIPAAVIGAAKDLHVDAHQPVTVPVRYGRHLIADRFAVEAPPPVAEKVDAKSGRKSATEKADAIAKAAAEKAAAERSDAIAKAESAVDEARALVDASTDDMVARGEAEKLLAEAEQSLADLTA